MVTSTERQRAVLSTRVRTQLERWEWLVFALLFVVLSIVWLALDSGVTDFDTTRHLLNTYMLRTVVWDHPSSIVTFDNLNHYPPLLYLVGAIGMTIAGPNVQPDGAMLAQNIVFAPLLALGCWGTARQAYGALAGRLAAIFALCTPMVVSLFHLYMLDVPQAACVAVCVWLILRSDRFAQPWYAAAGGAAGAAAVLVKPTSVIFLLGPFVVALIRGGWRQWRGVIAFLAVGAALALPWIIDHYSQLNGLLQGAAGGAGGGGGGASSEVTPPRWSAKNLAWYGWDLINVQLFAPFFAAFVAGVVTTTVRFVRERRHDDFTPELLAGGIVSWLGMTYISLKDPRYTLPALVFIAAFAVAWIPRLKPPLRRLAAGAIVAVGLINLIGGSFGLGPTLRVAAPGAPPPSFGLAERSVRFYMPGSFVASRPRDNADVLRLMRATNAAGIDTIMLEPGGDAQWNTQGLSMLVGIAGMKLAPFSPQRVPRHVVFLTRHPLTPGAPKPCGRMSQGWGLYLVRGGSLLVPFERYRFWCPPGFRPGV